jgi:hypothetical protein
MRVSDNVRVLTLLVPVLVGPSSALSAAAQSASPPPVTYPALPSETPAKLEL